MSAALAFDLGLNQEGAAVLRSPILFAPVHLRAPTLSPFPTATTQQTSSTSYAMTGSGNTGGGSAGSAAVGSGPGGSGGGGGPGAGTGTGTGTVASNGAAAVLDAKFTDLAADLLSDPSAGTAATRMARAADASFDFVEYGLLREPEDPISRSGGYPPKPIPADPRYARFTASARAGIMDAVDYGRLILGAAATSYANTLAATLLRDQLYSWWSAVCAVRSFNRLARYSPTDIASNAWATQDKSPEAFYGSSLAYWLMTKSGDDMRDFFQGTQSAIDDMMTVPYWEAVLTEVFDNYFSNLDIVDPSVPTGAYPFDPFPIDEVLFGLRIVHRQSWRQLAFARGDLVGTVPLGPRETKKVTVKTTRRTKTVRTSEEALAFETSAETTQTSKDVNEVVDEATSKLNRHVDAEVGGGYPPFFSAKVSGGVSDEAGRTSKQTKTNLNEMMEKTASRMKRDTKVTFSTEGETTFEQTGSAELVNPNDEVAITYLYHRLQQRFWVSTQIDEVNSIVLVPEPIPDFDDVTEEWIRTHGEVVASALLDPTFAPTVAAIRAEPGNLTYPTSPVFTQAAGAAIKAVNDYRTFAGAGDVPDVLGSGQQFYERDYERRSTLAMSQTRRSHQARDLIDHIRRNILYYMRAIWSREDPDQRLQRYSRLRVPVSWTFVPLTPLPANAMAGDLLDTEGVFMPDVGSAVPLDKVIDPVGPIGYWFNCIIWRVRDDPKRINLHQALAHLRAAYTRFAVSVSFASSSGMKLRHAVAAAPRRFSADYTITWRSNRNKWLIPIAGLSEMDWIELNPLPDGSINVLGVRLWLEGTPTNLEVATVSLRVTGDLEDPHLRLVMLQNPLPSAAQEASFFSDPLLDEMANLFEWPASVGNKFTWSTMTEAQKAEARRSYHRYLMLRESGRLVTVDSANLVLDLEVGRSAALEPFKRLHRYIDVMKEHEEMRRRQLDNTRRDTLLAAGRLADPDIERITVVAGPPGKIKDLVIIDDDQPGPDN